MTEALTMVAAMVLQAESPEGKEKEGLPLLTTRRIEFETLRAATLHGAEIVGLTQDHGSIEAGKLADLVVLDANPLEDIHNTNTVRYVVKNGEVFEGSTFDRIWPSPKKLQPFGWWTSSTNSLGGGRD